ncbi:MAG: ferredoxin family protein [Candidatus Zixiibacteriota bacterium]|nr:MAG: ferredoxin family protein [candidate division Zixibacteria bacterium]
MGLRYLPDVVTLELEQQRCTGCTMCVLVCPHAVFQMTDKEAEIIDRDACIECGACAINCPEEAIRVRPGVGCAAAVLTGWIRGSEPSCDCSDDEPCC